MRDTVQEELDSVKRWAEENNLQLNQGKSREMIIPWHREMETPLLLQDVGRVASMKILCVTMHADVRTISHVHEILTSCSGSLQALWILRYHGLPSGALQVVTVATTVAHDVRCPALVGLHLSRRSG